MQTYQAYQEKELLQLIATADEEAFEQVFEHYREKLYFYMKRITKSPEISEEIEPGCLYRQMTSRGTRLLPQKSLDVA